MKQIDWLILEICTECNLSHIHHKCPNLHPDRYKLVDTSKPLTDDKIISLVKEAYNNLGFEGKVGFHYYNEPLIAKERMINLIRLIKTEVPQAGFVLWTNGELLPAASGDLSVFDTVYVTNYFGKNFDDLKASVPQVKVVDADLDGRLYAKKALSNAPCHRMYGELVIDYFGNVHICCIDWRGEVKVGNVWKKSLSDIQADWQEIRNSISGKTMRDNAPETCRRCTCRELPPGYWTWRQKFRKKASLLLKTPWQLLRKLTTKHTSS